MTGTSGKKLDVLCDLNHSPVLKVTRYVPFSRPRPSGYSPVIRPFSLVAALLSKSQFFPSCFSNVTLTPGEGRPSCKLSTCTLNGFVAADARAERALNTAPAKKLFKTVMVMSLIFNGR